jgi:CheY-like chemotaxis protein
MQPPEPDFRQQVRDALAHLHATGYLERHPLADQVSSEAGSGLRRGQRLRKLLLETIDDLRPARVTQASQAEARRHQHLVLRYVEGLSPEQVARRLNVSPRQSSRDLQQALDELTLLVWNRRLALSGAVPTDVSAPASVSALELRDVIRGVLGTLRKLLGERSPSVRVSLPDTLPTPAVEPDLLRQALLNLLLSMAADMDGRVAITASESPRGISVQLSVEEARGRRPSFADLSSASGDRRALLDSGQRLVRMLGGELRIGQDITLGVPAGGFKLLVVDDNPDVGALFRRYLRGGDYRVLQATSGGAALQLAQEFSPDLVLLDVLLPRRDGWEIMSDLRSTPGMENTPIVICSVLPEEAMARSLQAADFLAKPVTRQSLLGLLERWRRSEQIAPPHRS